MTGLLLLAYSLPLLAFMFSMGCCCGPSPCTGSGTGNCCLSTIPGSIDLTLPADFGNSLCTSCGSLAGTYTLPASAANKLACDGSGALGPPFVGYYHYSSPSFCSVTSGTCGAQTMDLLIHVQMLCFGGTCFLRAYVTLYSQAPSVCCCKYGWRYEATFSSGTDCDTEVFSLPYVEPTDNGCSGGTACTVSGTPSPVTIVKT